tara:strand:+ start:1758 stop:3191 length:1434 start_codon:yes stop_codon:yes gene_type:complete
MSRLNEKDLEILSTGQTVNLSSPINSYLGGKFGTNVNDFVQASVYDMNDNFLESGIVHIDDYQIVESESGNNVKLKTGTILRKLGYDRGRFKVKYHFLRRVAGSHETVLVNNTGDIYTDDFNPNTEGNRIGKDLFIKENKYFIHEISPSRTEIRLAAQNIKWPEYLDNFENLQVTTKTITNEDLGPIEFVVENGSGDSTPLKEDSKTIKLSDETKQFPLDVLTNSRLVVPNAYIINHTKENIGIDEGSHSEGETESTTLQPRYFIDSILEGAEFEVNNSSQIQLNFHDRTLTKYYTQFKQYNLPSQQNQIELFSNDRPYGVDMLPNSNDRIIDVIKTRHSYYKSLMFRMANDSNVNPKVRIRSNGSRPGIPHTYTWEITGFSHSRINNQTQYSPVSRTHFDFDTTAGGPGSDVNNPKKAVLEDMAFDENNSPYVDIILKPPTTNRGYYFGIILTITSGVDPIGKTIHYPVMLGRRPD